MEDEDAARRQDRRDLCGGRRDRRRRRPAFAREAARLFLTGRDVAKVEAVAEEIVAAGGVIIASDRAGAMTETVANVSAGSITD